MHGRAWHIYDGGLSANNAPQGSIIDTPLNVSPQARTFPTMEPASKEYVDLKAEVVAAQNNARFAEVLAEIKGLRSDIATKPSSWQVWGAALTGFGAILAVLAFAGDRFDGGISLADQRQEQIQRDTAQDAIIKRLDALLAAQPTQSAPAPESPSE